MAEVQPREKAAPPVARVQVGSVQGAAWRQMTKDGKPFYVATFEVRYKDGETWKSGGSYNQTDLLCLAQATSMLFMDIEGLKAKDKAAGNPGREPGAEG